MIDGLHSANIVPTSTEPIAVFVKNTESDPVVARLLDTSKSKNTDVFNNLAKNQTIKATQPAFNKPETDKESSKKSDVFKDSLKDTLKSKKADKEESSKKAVKKALKPSPADILNADSLDAIVPNGFLLIHNDLKSIIDIVGRKQPEKKKSGLGAGLAGAAIGGLAVAAIASVGPELAPILADPGANKKLVTDTYDIRLGKTKELLEAHYQHLIDGYANGGSFATKAGDIFKESIGGIVEGAGRSLVNIVSEAGLEKDPDIIKIRKEGLVTYLTAYYKDLIDSFNKEGIIGFLSDTGKGLGGLVGSTIESISRSATNVVAEVKLGKDPDVYEIRKTGFISYLNAYYKDLTDSFANKGFLEKAGDALSSIAQSAVESLGRSATNVAVEIKLSKDSDVYEIRKKGFVNYLNAYYTDLIESLTDNGLGKVLNDVGKSVGNLASSLIEGIGRSVNNVAVEQQLSKDSEVLKVRKAGLINYLTAYYNDLANSFNSRGLENILKDTGRSLGGFLGGITEGVGRSISTILTESDLLSTDPEIIAVQKAGYVKYLTAYYNDLTNSFSKKGLGGLLKDLGQSLGGFFGGVISGSGLNITKVVDEIDLSSDTAIVNTVLTKSNEYLVAYFDDLIKTYTDTGFSGILNEVGQGIGSFFSGTFDNTKSKIVGVIDEIDLVSDSTISSTILTKSNEYLIAYFDDLIKTYTDNGLSGILNELGQGLGSFFSGAFDGTKSKIVGLIDEVNLAGDTAIVDTVKLKSKEYIEAYYDDLINQYSETSLAGILGELGQGVSNFFSGIVNTGNKKIQDMIFSVDIITDESIVSVIKNKSKEYIEAYYDDLISQYKGISFADIVGSIGKSVGSFFGELFGKDNDPFEAIVDPTKFIGDSDLEAIKKEKLEVYVKAYYDKINVEATSASGWDKVADAFKSIAGIFSGGNGTSGVLEKIIDPSNLVYNPDIITIKKDAVTKIVNKYFDNILSNSEWSSARLTAKDISGEGKIGSGLNGVLRKSLEDLFGNIGNLDASLVFGSDVKASDITGIKVDVTRIYNCLLRVESLVTTLKSYTKNISENPATIIMSTPQDNPLGGL